MLDHINPADGVVTVAKGTPTEVTATITNKRLVGGVVINKLLEGAVAGASTEFTVDLNCDCGLLPRLWDSGAVNSGSLAWCRMFTGNILFGGESAR